MTTRGKIALVTGASRGIGRTVAEGLAQDGYSLIVAARSFDQLQALAEEIQSYHKVDCFPLQLDLGVPQNVGKTLSECYQTFGFPTVVFNNAGAHIQGTLEPSVEEYEKVLAVNLVSAREVIKSVVPEMLERGSGHIISLSSIAGKVGYAASGAYGSSKFALSGLSESLFHELSSSGISVSAICPSWVDTDMAAFSMMDGADMIQTEDLLATVRYLLSLSPKACVKEVVIECRSVL